MLVDTGDGSSCTMQIAARDQGFGAFVIRMDFP